MKAAKNSAIPWVQGNSTRVNVKVGHDQLITTELWFSEKKQKHEWIRHGGEHVISANDKDEES